MKIVLNQVEIDQEAIDQIRHLEKMLLMNLRKSSKELNSDLCLEQDVQVFFLKEISFAKIKKNVYFTKKYNIFFPSC